MLKRKTMVIEGTQSAREAMEQGSPGRPRRLFYRSDSKSIFKVLEEKSQSDLQARKLAASASTTSTPKYLQVAAAGRRTAGFLQLAGSLDFQNSFFLPPGAGEQNTEKATSSDLNL